MLINLAVLLFSYLTGSLASAVIISKLMGLPDPRSAGSRNPGATNVLRLGNRRAAVIVLLADMLKGLLPVLLAKAAAVPGPVLAGAGLAAFFGHLYPVFFGFRGGKGVATSLGVLLGFAWPVGLACVATWLITAVLSRFSSLAALCAAFMAPLYMHWYGAAQELLVATVIMTTLLVWRHRGNIQNLLNGTETKIRARH